MTAHSPLHTHSSQHTLSSQESLSHPQVLACLLSCLARQKGSWRSAALLALEGVLSAAGQDCWGLVSEPLVQACERNCAAKVGGRV